MIGISYKSAPVEIREKFSFSKENIPTVLADIHDIPEVSECVVLSTCNRTEIYVVTHSPAEIVREMIEQYILDYSGMKRDYLDYFYCFEGKKVIEQLFNVTSGLDSMILGETQIPGQVKHSYALACDSGYTGSALNRLFHHAFQVGKQIRNNTSIGEGAVSISSAAVLLAKEIFSNLEKRKVLLVGTGKIGKVCAKQLVDAGVEELFITNRTLERASELSVELSGHVIAFEDMADQFDKVDIIITSTTISEPIITREFLEKNFSGGNGKRLSLIDMGVPRNIDPDVANIENIHLFNIDDLKNVTMENMDKREAEAEKAGIMINQKVDEYFSWLKEQEVVPVINDLREKCETIRLGELNKITHKVSEKTSKTIDLVTRRIVRKILHNPTITMRASESDVVRKRLIESIHELFINDSVKEEILQVN